ncbi:PREDICTED: uncharacterized protein LOC107067647 [Polistes dominula]|uniref:Uncharacterized protein LOC107067647 n=1 Tax=Polistes dominula TaxID=743375 RepID=A0ABM1IF16_POLDO|nr:PREDICTED: uncharacterized protein LOC107067647 [Polistes dominula]
MINITRSIIGTGYKNHRNLFLRLTRDTKNICNVNYKPNKMNKLLLRPREKFNYYVINRTYSNQLSNINVQSTKQELHDDYKDENVLTENQYARNYFLNSVHYNKTTVPQRKLEVIISDAEAEELLNKDWSTATINDLVSALKRLSHHIENQSDHDVMHQLPKYNLILHALKKNSNHLTYDLLEEILISLIPFQKHLGRTKEFKDLMASLDNYCAKQYINWPIESMFLISDAFYCLYYYNSNFVWKFMRKMNSKLNKLTTNNLVQLMFLVNIRRDNPLNMYEVESVLDQHLDDLTINELGLIAMGFFKSKSKIRDSALLKQMTDRLARDINIVDKISLTSLLKLIRYSMKFNELENLKLLMKCISPMLPTYDFQSLGHIVHVFAKAHLYSKPFMDVIITSFFNNIEKARLKDIEKLTFALCIYSFESTHPIWNKIVDELTCRISNDKKEIFKFPWIFVSIIRYLCFSNVYPLHLIKLVLDPSYVSIRCKGNVYLIGWEYSIIEYCVKVEQPEYTGPFLSENILLTSTKRHWKIMDLENSSLIRKIFNEVMFVLKETVVKDVDLYNGRVLPQFVKNNIVVGIDEHQNFISAKPILSKKSETDIKRVDDTFPENIKWLIFVVFHYKHTIRETNSPTGILMAKLRQLKLIGYTPIVVSSHEWFQLGGNIEGKTNYLKNLITNAK